MPGGAGFRGGWALSRVVKRPGQGVSGAPDNGNRARRGGNGADLVVWCLGGLAPVSVVCGEMLLTWGFSGAGVRKVSGGLCAPVLLSEKHFGEARTGVVFGGWGSHPSVRYQIVTLTYRPFRGGRVLRLGNRNPLWLLCLAKHAVLQHVSTSSQVAGGASINQGARSAPTRAALGKL